MDDALEERVIFKIGGPDLAIESQCNNTIAQR
jgi:hypothetical protein